MDRGPLGIPAGGPCPPPEQLRGYLDDRLDADSAARIESHAQECADCQASLESMVAGLSIPASPRDPLSSSRLEMFKRLDPTRSTVVGDAEPARPRGERGASALPAARAPGEGATAPRRGAGDAPGWPEPPGFVVIGELGRGGMGVVYLARQLGLGREVALKMILAPDPAEWANARFRAEAEAIARLQHPQVVQVHAIGEHAGRPFLAMEYVPGGSLAGRLDGTPWLPRRAAELVAALADGIREAHRVGVVHRDLKPSNILMGRDDIPKIADFGLAKLLDANSEVTRSGVLIGSPSYMAPEQAAESGGSIGPSADIHALGVILYELTTGRPPYRAATVLETLELVRKAEPPPPSRLVPGLPRDLETIALKCLEKEPRQRYSSADGLAADLGRWLAGEPIEARRSPFWERAWKSARRRPYRAATIVLTQATLVIVLGILSWSYRKIGEALEVARLDRLKAVAAKAESDRLAKSESEARAGAARRSAARALDQGVLLAESGRVGRGLLWIGRASEAAVDLDAPLRRAALASLADWRRLATRPQSVVDLGMPVYNFDASPDLGIVALGGAGRPAVLDLADFREVARLPGEMDWKVKAALGGRGRRIVATDGKRARAWELPSGAPIGEFPARPGVAHPDYLIVDPSGRGVAMQDFVDGSLWFWDLAGKSSKVLSDAVTYGASFSPDGHLLATPALDGSTRVWDVRTRAIVRSFPKSAEPSRAEFLPVGSALVLSGISSEPKVSVWDLDADRPRFETPIHAPITALVPGPDGRTLLIGGRDGSIRLLDASSGEPLGPVIYAPSPVLASNNYDAGDMSLRSALALSPDGRTILSTHADSTARTWDVATGRPVGSVLEHPSILVGATFGDDGRTLVTASGGGQLIRWDLAEGPTGRPLAHRAGLSLNRGEASPDGRLVVATGRFLRYAALVDVATGLPRTGPLLHEGQHVKVARFSPDGSLVATGGDDRRARIWDTSTGRPAGPPLVGGHWVVNLAFTPDGRTLLAIDASQRLSAWDVKTGRPLTSTTPIATPLHVAILLVSPDGRSVVTKSLDGGIWRWELPSFRRLGDPFRAPIPREKGDDVAGPGRTPDPEPFAFSPDGSSLWLVESPGPDGSPSVVRRDPATWRPIGSPIGRAVNTALLSTDGRKLLTLSGTTVRQYDAETGSAIGAAMEHPSTALSAAISPDGTMVATGSGDGGLRFWDSAKGRPIGPPRAHPGAVGDVKFVGDGSRVVTFADIPTLWDVPRPLSGEPSRIDAENRRISMMELDEEDDGTRRLDTETWRRLPVEGDDASTAAEWHERSAARFALQGPTTAALWHLDRLLRLRPDDPTALLRRASVLAKIGDRAGAAADESRAATLAPGMADARQLWEDYDSIDRPTLAGLGRLIAARPGQVEFLLKRADLLVLAGRRSEALVDLREAIRLQPSLGGLENARREALLDLDQGDLARYHALCDRFQFKDPATLPLHPAIGLARLFTLGDGGAPDRALRLAEAKIAGMPQAKRGEFSGVLGVALYRVGRHVEAAGPLADSSLLGELDSPHYWAYLAMNFHKLGDDVSARPWLDRIRAWKPSGTVEHAWHDLEIEILRREAIAVVDPDRAFPANPFLPE